MRKLIAFDDDTAAKLAQLARDRMATFQELADEAFADLLKKHGIPVDLKDASHVGMERATSNQRFDRGALLEMGIDCDQRLGPKASARVNCVNLISDILGADLSERPSKARVVRNECAIQIKDIHDD